MKKIGLLAVGLLAIASFAAARTPANFYDGASAPPRTESHTMRAVVSAQTGGGHSASLTWVLSADDTTTACTTSANCFQIVYRASGACSTSSSFTPLNGAVAATAAAFTDSTITPGVWCYAVTFDINALESLKDTLTVSLQPASPSSLAATTR